MIKNTLKTGILAAVLLSSSLYAKTQSLPNYERVTLELKKIVKEKNGGFSLNMWATLVNRDGIVKVVTFSGENRSDQWPGSRVIAAQKANTANAFSLPSLSLSTANLFTATQDGGSLFGLQHSNPVDTSVAYGGSSETMGLKNDYMLGKKIGGINVFGGGLALYSKTGVLLGALGVSGDSSCADHNIAWKLRAALKLDTIPGGVNSDGSDNIVNDINNKISKSGWGHPKCSEAATEIAKNLNLTHPINKK